MAKAEKTYTPRFKERYETELRKKLKETHGYANDMEIPSLEKIVLNMGVGEASQNKNLLKAATEEMTLIAGQKPVVTVASKSNASFKIREGMPIGVKVTLRGARMYEFLDRLVTIALPRVRDFRGINPKSFDGRGNYALGITEHIVFPEIEYDKVEKIRGLDITIVTYGTNKNHTLALLEEFNFPFIKEKKNWV